MSYSTLFWHYESDGEQGARTHYAVRENWDRPLGIERMEFRTAKQARDFVQKSNALIAKLSRPRLVTS